MKYTPKLLDALDRLMNILDRHKAQGKQLGEMRIWRTARPPLAEILELFPEDTMGLLEYTKEDDELIVWNDIGVMGGSKGIRSVDGKKSVTMARA